MKPAAFLYHRAHSADEALALLAANEDAKVLAGGQSLIPAMNFRLAQPAALVDLNAVEELAYIRESAGGGLAIGAMTRQRAAETSALVAQRAPLLAEALPWVAHPQIRNRGTIGGTIAHADPASEVPAVMVALGAGFRVLGSGGQRIVPAAEFFTGLFATALEPGELLAEVEIPAMPQRAGWSFIEVARRHGDYALVGVATLIGLDAKGACDLARVVLLSVGDGPVLSPSASAALVGRVLDADAITDAAAAVQSDIDPPGDIHASSAYRRKLASVLVSRALGQAVRRSGGQAVS